jgi:hypothetical protein
MNSNDLSTDSKNIPALLDANGVRKHIAPIGRTLLYELASAGEIDTVSFGMGKRGKRLFVTSSLLDYIRRRSEITLRPKMGRRNAQGADASFPEYAGYWTSSAGVAL